MNETKDAQKVEPKTWGRLKTAIGAVVVGGLSIAASELYGEIVTAIVWRALDSMHLGNYYLRWLAGALVVGTFLYAIRKPLAEITDTIDLAIGDSYAWRYGISTAIGVLCVGVLINFGAYAPAPQQAGRGPVAPNIPDTPVPAPSDFVLSLPLPEILPAPTVKKETLPPKKTPPLEDLKPMGTLEELIALLPIAELPEFVEAPHAEPPKLGPPAPPTSLRMTVR